MSESRVDAGPEAHEAPEGPPVPHLLRGLLVLTVGPLSLLLFELASAFPWTVERAYAFWLGPALVRVLTSVSGATSLPLVAFVGLGVLGWVGWRLHRELRAAPLRGRGRRWGFVSWLLVTGETLSVLTALFYLLWGLNYARPSLEARLGWDEVGEVPAEELAELAVQAVRATNEAYRTLHGSDDAASPTRMPADRRGLERALTDGWGSAAEELEPGSGRILGRWHGRVKTLWGSGVLTELGLLGFYSPFTGEAVVNGRAPAVILPRSMAHEQAHQRGIAPEDEANFMAIMAAIRAPHSLARYAASASIQRRLLNDLAAVDQERALELARDRLPGVRRDARDLDEFYQSLQGPVNEVADRVNDAYLRHHRVEGGVLSYGLVTRLLVAYARRNGGALPAP